MQGAFCYFFRMQIEMPHLLSRIGNHHFRHVPTRTIYFRLRKTYLKRASSGEFDVNLCQCVMIGEYGNRCMQKSAFKGSSFCDQYVWLACQVFFQWKPNSRAVEQYADDDGHLQLSDYAILVLVIATMTASDKKKYNPLLADEVRMCFSFSSSWFSLVMNLIAHLPCWAHGSWFYDYGLLPCHNVISRNGSESTSIMVDANCHSMEFCVSIKAKITSCSFSRNDVARHGRNVQ